MKEVNFSFNYKGRKFSIEAEECKRANWGLGLMFKTRNTKPLLFNFGREINWTLTSLFVFFPFLALWLDDKNNVIDMRVVKPFIPGIISKKPFSKLLEIPINDKNRELIGQVLNVHSRYHLLDHPPQ